MGLFNTATLNKFIGKEEFIGGSGSTPIQAEITTYEANVIAQGSTLSTTQKDALNTFVAGCKTDGTWSKLLEVWPLMGSSLAGAMVKLKDSSSTPVMTAVNCIAGDYNETNGLTGGGSKYVETGFTTNVFSSTTNASHGFYMSGTGAVGAIAGNDTMLDYFGTGLCYFGPGQNIAFTPLAAKAWYFWEVLSGANSRFYRDDTALFGPYTLSIPRNATRIPLMARDNAGAIVQLAAFTHRFHVYSAVLTSGEKTSLYNRVVTLMTAVGR
jgi:hypothetical protein